MAEVGVGNKGTKGGGKVNIYYQVLITGSTCWFAGGGSGAYDLNWYTLKRSQYQLS